MTQQSFRELYAGHFSSAAQKILNEFESVVQEVEKLPENEQPNSIHNPFALGKDPDECVLLLRSLIRLANLPGKDPITITADDMGTIIWLEEFKNMLQEFLSERVPFSE